MPKSYWGKMASDTVHLIKVGDRIRWYEAGSGSQTGIVQNRYCGSFNVLEDKSQMAERVYDTSIFSVQRNASGEWYGYDRGY